nr:reverse transcriptase domain-containing protein [Tanacetum cinerariifolium]
MMASFFQINIASTSGSGPLPRNTIANPKGDLKANTSRSGLVLDGPSVPMPHPFINPEEDERVEETLTDPDLAEYTIKVPPPIVQKAKPPSQRNYMKILKVLLSNKEKLLELANTPLNENCSAVILKKLPEKLGDPKKFLISCGFSELKCKALADLGASINLMPLSVWKNLGLPELIYTRMTLELANRAICTMAGIARDVFVLVSKFTFLADFFIVNYESDPRVPLVLGRPFLRTACALIDVHEEELILRDVINPLSGSTTSSSPDHLLEEFIDELDLITFPPGKDDLLFDIEFDLRELEYLLNHDPTKEMDYILEDSVDECNLADPSNKLFDTIPEMFADEHTLDYSSPLLYDDYDDDLVELESDNDDAYNDPFDSNEDKIKESNLLIDELNLPRSSDFLASPEYDSFLFEDFFRVTVQVTPVKNVKKISISNASLILEDFDHPLSDHELPFQK